MESPFNMLIVGMTVCRKTKCLLDMLEKVYKNHFDYIILICPTFDFNKTYQEWKYVKEIDFIAIQCDQDKVDMILKYIVDVYKGSNSLIILDDCAVCQDVKNRVSELVRLAFTARHFNLSTIVIMQQLTSIAKPYCENISNLVTFYNPNCNDIKNIIDDYLYELSKDEINNITESLRK